MVKFLVQHDFAKYQPAWRGDYVRRFGEGNEGFEIEAKDEQDAREQLKTQHNLNPFYLKITQRKG